MLDEYKLIIDELIAQNAGLSRIVLMSQYFPSINNQTIEKLYSAGGVGDLPLQMFQEKRMETGQLQGEVWRIFVFAMLFFLMGEAILILPSKPVMERTGRQKEMVAGKAG